MGIVESATIFSIGDRQNLSVVPAERSVRIGAVELVGEDRSARHATSRPRLPVAVGTVNGFRTYSVFSMDRPTLSALN